MRLCRSVAVAFTPSGAFLIPSHEDFASGECGLIVAASNEGAGVASVVGDDGAAGAGVVCASSIGQARAMDMAARSRDWRRRCRSSNGGIFRSLMPRSEEHTSELQSLRHLVCRLLLEKK